MSEKISSFKDLRVYKLAFEVQQEIFETSKRFPVEERYALTDQIRRASRSIGANLGEAWQKRRYVAHFISKLTDADGEQAETQHWLDTATACDYLAEHEQKAMLEKCLRIGQMLGTMMAKPEKFCQQKSSRSFGQSSVTFSDDPLFSAISHLTSDTCAAFAASLILRGDEPVEPEIVRRMTDSIAHRGPDDEGYFFSGRLGLDFDGFPSSTWPAAISRCPMPSETVWIIFNGEIYNYKELRAELEQRRPLLSHELRHGGYRPRLQRVGDRRFQSSQWHVRGRHLGCQRKTAGRRARCHGHQTHLLPNCQWPD